jgi:hypothetical protein
VRIEFWRSTGAAVRLLGGESHGDENQQPNNNHDGSEDSENAVVSDGLFHCAEYSELSALKTQHYVRVDVFWLSENKRVAGGISGITH